MFIRIIIAVDVLIIMAGMLINAMIVIIVVLGLLNVEVISYNYDSLGTIMITVNMFIIFVCVIAIDVGMCMSGIVTVRDHYSGGH